MEELYMEFYTAKEEASFLEAYQAKHGKLTDEEIDDLYAQIADAIDQDIKNGNHELGKPYSFQGVELGRSDYNSFHNLYFFGK